MPVEGPFDYIVPQGFAKKIKIGSRVRIGFGARRMIGYIVGFTEESKIKNLKPILELIDDFNLLDKNMLLLTKELSCYYCCSWGEAIETTLPKALRIGKRINLGINTSRVRITQRKFNPDVTLLHDLEGTARWDIYLKQIRQALEEKRSVIILFSDIDSFLKAKEIIVFHLGVSPIVLYRKQPRELEEWLKAKEGKANIIIGTRSAIFAPLSNLGLIIIDEEQDTVYKQDQVPHYNAREVAFMRVNIDAAKLILASTAPSSEMFNLVKKNKIGYNFIPLKSFPEIKILNTSHEYYRLKRKFILSKYLEDLISANLSAKGKILLFLNRKGFATFASCRYCGMVLKCPRCNINLVYYFQDNILNCHYCNFKMPAPKICPNCNSSYIRYSGTGTEKIESEISRTFPQARIKRVDKQTNIDIDAADIFVSAQSIIRKNNYNFSLIAVLSLDNSLNRIDFRASEKAFALLVGLLRLTQEKFAIQTNLPRHHVFSALENKDVNIFYDAELKQRKQLNFPPYSHLGIVKLRSVKEDRVLQASLDLFKKLDRTNRNKNIELISVNPGQPAKLRGKFYRQILIRSDNAKSISKFLKIHLKDFSHSGIIVTVDIDPI